MAKVVILAGGYGSRLGNMSEFLPKPMVMVGGKPILWHIMKIYSSFGFNDFVICLGYKGDIIKNYFHHYHSLNNDFTIDLSKKNSDIKYHGNNGEENWKVTLVDTGLNTLKGGRIKRIEKYLDDEVNMLTYGDGVGNVNIKELFESHKSHNKALTITGVYPPSLFGEIIEENNKIVAFEEKPQTSKGLINGGFMVFSKKMLNYLTEDENCDFEFGPVNNMVKEGEVMVYKHEGFWECADTPRDVENLNKLWNNNKAFWKTW